jgi:membrane protein YdbS with pleckstrin-like domain
MCYDKYGMEKEQVEKNITVTHINIRESISILLLKIITLDFMAAIFTILFFTVVSFSPSVSINEKILSYNVLFFVILGVLKICFTVYVILLWLNEYYEITPHAVIHKKGIIYRDTQRYELEFVRTIKVYQGLLGRILNFGTIELHDIRRNKRVEMYLIHNPQRFVRILEKLLENPHEEKHELRKHIFSKDKNDDGEDDDVDDGSNN